MPRPLPLGPPQGVAVQQVPEPLHPRPEEVMSVNATIPLIALAALVVYIAYRHQGLQVWHAVVCALLGFLLAATSAAPQIRIVIAGILQWFQTSGKG
jgi:hypothetical protein